MSLRDECRHLMQPLRYISVAATRADVATMLVTSFKSLGIYRVPVRVICSLRMPM